MKWACGGRRRRAAPPPAVPPVQKESEATAALTGRQLVSTVQRWSMHAGNIHRGRCGFSGEHALVTSRRVVSTAVAAAAAAASGNSDWRGGPTPAFICLTQQRGWTTVYHSAVGFCSRSRLDLEVFLFVCFLKAH